MSHDRRALARQLRDTTDMTVVQIASELGVTKSTVCRWTQRAKPPAPTVMCPICFQAGCTSSHPECSPPGGACTACGSPMRKRHPRKLCGFCLEEERLGVAA
jgi:rRNA maturation endonuclease Nob1